jgi:hypothetical protein
MTILEDQGNLPVVIPDLKKDVLIVIPDKQFSR